MVSRRTLLLPLAAAAALSTSLGAQDDSARAPRRTAALFESRAPIELSVVANLRSLRADKVPGADHPYRYAQVRVADSAGAEKNIPAEIRTRGKWRLRECDNPPMRLRVVAGETGGTMFARARRTRVVMPCRNSGDYEQYVLLEYAAYRILEELTPLSYQARLTRLTLVDSASGRRDRQRWAILVEDDEDAAARFGGEAVELPEMEFKDLDQEQTRIVALFQYMIGNPDWILGRLHNVSLVRMGWVATPVAYDFDWTGFVNPHYGSPDPQLRISNLRQRVYLGPCMTEPELSAVAARFVEKEGAMMRVLDEVPGLDERRKNNAVRYLSEFLTQARDVRRLAREVDRRCVK
jgi:hypothetical protein